MVGGEDVSRKGSGSSPVVMFISDLPCLSDRRVRGDRRVREGFRLRGQPIKMRRRCGDHYGGGVDHGPQGHSGPDILPRIPSWCWCRIGVPLTCCPLIIGSPKWTPRRRRTLSRRHCILERLASSPFTVVLSSCHVVAVMSAPREPFRAVNSSEFHASPRFVRRREAPHRIETQFGRPAVNMYQGRS